VQVAYTRPIWFGFQLLYPWSPVFILKFNKRKPMTNLAVLKEEEFYKTFNLKPNL